MFGIGRANDYSGEAKQEESGKSLFEREIMSFKNKRDYDTSIESAVLSLKEQRKDLYFRLKGLKGYEGLSKDKLEMYFHKFGIQKSKKRKRKLSELVWSSKGIESGSEMYTHSTNIVLSCLESTDIDLSLRWREHRMRVNITQTLRASLQALKGRFT